MHRWRSQLTVATVALILGVLVVAQLRGHQAGAGLAGLSSQDLTILIANLNTRNDQLRREVASLERDLSVKLLNQSRGASSVDQLRTDLARTQAWAGLAPVFGPGVTITIAGPLPGPAAQGIVNELWNAGAEAIAIEDVRIVPGVVVAGGAGDARLGGRPLDDPFEIRAIGSPETLTGSLTRIGGVIAQLGATHPDVLLTVTPLERMDLPATTRTMVPEHGGPRL